MGEWATVTRLTGLFMSTPAIWIGGRRAGAILAHVLRSARSKAERQ